MSSRSGCGGWRASAGRGVRAAALAGVVATLGIPLATTRPAHAASALAIRVAGNELVDGSGNPVTLRGANISGTEFACIQGGTPTSRGWSIFGGQPMASASTYQAMAAWHVNAVRVPLNEDCWLGINGVNPSYGGAAYRSAIEQEVSAIHAAGMYAVLDLHWSSPGAWAAYGQQPTGDADHSISFWSSVASTFKSDPAVIFDLYNEPFFYYISDGSNEWDCWLHGCQMNQFVSANQTGPNGQPTGYTTSYTWQTAGMQQMLDAVRGAGATQPVMANGADWANDDSGWLSHTPVDPDHQLIAGWHSYPAEACDTQSCWDADIAPIAHQYPVLVGETGDNTSGSLQYLPTFLPWAESHGLSYMAWTWNPWQNSTDVLITDWNGTPTSGEGAFYKNWLASHTGPDYPGGSTTPPTTPPPTTPPPTTPPPPGSPQAGGYWLAGSDGGVFTFGTAGFYGSASGTDSTPTVTMAATPDHGGYWLLDADGAVHRYGDASTTGSVSLPGTATALAVTPDGAGYWITDRAGDVFSLGDAVFHGSAGGIRLNAPVVGMAPTADGGGYWLVASDGGVFTFGDAVFHGSAGGIRLNAPVVGMAPTADGGGYWLVASDGGVFTFGDAVFHGSAGGIRLNAPVVGMAAVG